MLGVKPSFTTGFAQWPGMSEYPQLWEGLDGVWRPSLGATGNKVLDMSGRHNTGVFTGGTDIKWSPGPFGPCLDFGGTDTYVKCPLGFNNATTGTWVFWLFWRASNVSDCFIVSTSQNPMFTHSGTSMRVHFGAWHVDGYPYDFYIGALESRWIMYAATYDTVRARGYKDGLPYTEQAANPLNPLNVASSNLYIGSDRSIADRVPDVMMDCILAYNRPLLASEIALLYQMMKGMF